MTNRIPAQVELLVLAVHRRNGGHLSRLDLSWRLLEPILGIDSLDLAEIIVGIEREFGFSPFDGPRAPGTWGELVEVLNQGQS
jgi:hypothetical protein